MGIEIAVLDDDSIFVRRLKKIIELKGEKKIDVFFKAQDFLQKLQKKRYALLFLDLGLPEVSGFEVLEIVRKLNYEMEVIVITGDMHAESAVRALKQGASDYLVKPINKHKVELCLQTTLERIKLKRENKKLKALVLERDEFIANCPAMSEVLAVVKKVAPLNCNVLIQGETGTGKEMIARMLHNLSPRRDAPFIGINCGLFTEELMANELFGHVKEAFTGARTSTPGILQAAHKGTVFLDEIGDLPLNLQGKLLKVIEEKQFFPLGSVKPVQIDVRFVAATNKDLKKMIANKTFREDLFFRLNVVCLQLPRLADRKQDIKPLANYFMGKYQFKFNKKLKGISEQAMSFLLHYDFPGNVRELENIIQRAVALADDNTTIEAQHLPPDLINLEVESITPDMFCSLEELEKQHIKRILDFTGNNKKLASLILGLSKTTLWRKIKQFNLEPVKSMPKKN